MRRYYVWNRNFVGQPKVCIVYARSRKHAISKALKKDWMVGFWTDHWRVSTKSVG